MAYAWIYVINDGSGVPKIVRTSHSATTVVQIQPGEYVVTFPITVPGLAAVGSLGNSVGTMTVVPGESSALSPNQVRVLTLTLQNQLNGAYHFNLAVFYPARWPWWPWVVGALLVAAALFLLRG
jgi:hypothetical protein